MQITLAQAAQAAALLQERRAQDPLPQWEPTRPQVEFLEADEAEAWFLAANRAGKSDALAALIASLARTGNTNPRPAYGPSGVVVLDKAVSIWAISLTFPLGRDILQPKIFDNTFVSPGQPHKPFIPDWEILRWTTTDQVLKLKNGSLIGFKSCDQGRDLFQGVGKDLVAFDEAPPFSIYDEATMRVEGGRRLLIRGAATLLPPEGMVGGVSWIFPKKIQPYQQAAGKVPGLRLVAASIYDNPHILATEVERLEAKYPEGSNDRRIRLNGEWLPGIGGALAYPSFNRSIHVRKDLTRTSVEPRIPLIWTLDFNVEPMGTLVCQKVGRMYRVLDEITLEVASDTEIAEEFKKRYPTHGAELWIHGDATGKRRNVQTKKSDYTIVLEALRGLPYPVSMKVPEVNPLVTDRVNAVNMSLRGVRGEVRVEVAGHCDDFIADMEEVLRDPKGGIKKVSRRDDPYCRRTSWSDAFGYMVAYHDPIIPGFANSERRTVRVKSPQYNRRY